MAIIDFPNIDLMLILAGERRRLTFWARTAFIIDGVGAYWRPVAFLCKVTLHKLSGGPKPTNFAPNARGLNACNSQRQWVGPLRLGERKRAVVLLY